MVGAGARGHRAQRRADARHADVRHLVLLAHNAPRHRTVPPCVRHGAYLADLVASLDGHCEVVDVARCRGCAAEDVGLRGARPRRADAMHADVRHLVLLAQSARRHRTAPPCARHGASLADLVASLDGHCEAVDVARCCGCAAEVVGLRGARPLLGGRRSGCHDEPVLSALLIASELQRTRGTWCRAR